MNYTLVSYTVVESVFCCFVSFYSGLQKIKKDFYYEDPDVKSMTSDEADYFRCDKCWRCNN